jgi:hypothetical protein
VTDIARGPMGAGKAVYKREGTRAGQSEEIGMSADSPQRHDAALPRDCRDSSGHIQMSIPRVLREPLLENSHCTEGSRAVGSCAGEGEVRRLSSDSVSEHCSCIGRWEGGSSISKGSTSLPNHSCGARTCGVEVGCTPRSNERHWRHKPESCMCLCRRGTSCWLKSGVQE